VTKSDMPSRRIMLVAAGGVVATAVVGLVTRPGSGGTKPVAATQPRQAQPWAQPHRTPVQVAHHKATHDETVDAEPMYYVHGAGKAIALTIDDGPSPIYTPQILQLLERYKITASFSMIGRNVDYYPEVAREVKQAGHLIVNHTWDHSDLAPLSATRVADEIARATDAIHRATGETPRMFRAPYGAWSRAVLEYCGRNGLAALDWSVDPRDWAMPGTTEIVDNILDNTRPGSIILEHDGGGNRSETVAALGIVIPRLLDAGYHFTTA
jgi:peptidoglycan-N-acetylglucosamine deacetylase